MPATALGWDLRVTRGPDSLWVKLEAPDDSSAILPELADEIWSLLDQHFTYRLVLDVSAVPHWDRHLLSQLLLLQRRIRHHGGLMRICGLSSESRELVESSRLNGRFPNYGDLEEAVMGSWPRLPR